MTTHIIQEDTIQPLVSAITSARASSQPRLPHWKRLSTRLKLSKTALVVLLWNAVVGATYGIVFSGVLAVGFIEKPKNDPVQGLSFHPALYITLGVMMLISAVQFFLYPFSGLIAGYLVWSPEDYGDQLTEDLVWIRAFDCAHLPARIFHGEV